MKECLRKMKQCCDKVFKDDGRKSDGRSGDWGSHSRVDRMNEIREELGNLKEPSGNSLRAYIISTNLPFEDKVTLLEETFNKNK